MKAAIVIAGGVVLGAAAIAVEMSARLARVKAARARRLPRSHRAIVGA